MNTNFRAKSKNWRIAAYAAGITLSTLLGLGAFMASADAQERGRGYRGHHRNWNGGYYRAPPVIYGSPYQGRYYGAPGYYPPPPVYGPGFGLNFNFR